MNLIERISEGHAAGQHAVYLLSDADGQIVYVGRTMHLAARLQGHRAASDWWPLVSSGWWLPCADASEARLTERESIARYRPTGNTYDWQTLPAARVTLPDSAVTTLRALYDEAYGTPKGSEQHRRFNGYVWLLRANGWPLAAIGTPLGYTREAIRLRQSQARSIADLPAAPPLPRAANTAKPPARRRLRIRPEIAAHLRQLHAACRSVNGGTAADDPCRQVAVEFTETLAALVIQGVSMSEVARALGIHPYAVRSRLARHGYMDPVPSQAGVVYKGTPAHHLNDHCARGHELAGDNLRLINGDPKRRCCRACERIRVTAYRERQMAGAA